MITTANLALKIPEISDYLVNPATPGVDDTIAWLDHDFDILDNAVINTRNISSGNGLTGGGNLSTDRTLAFTTLTSDWDIGDGRMIQADKIRARDGDGLALYEDSGYGLFIQDGGHVGLNMTPVSTFDISDPAKPANLISVVANGNFPGFRFYVASDSAYAPSLQSWCYGGTLAVPTVTPSGRILGQFIFGGYATGAEQQGAIILAVTENAWSSGHRETSLRFGTSTTTSPAERMRITSDGNVGIGFTAPLAKLAINGGLHVGGDSDPSDNNLLVDGTTTITGNTTMSAALDHDGTTAGFYGTAPVVKPTVTGSKGGNAALASLITALVGLGLIVDSTT